MARSYFRVRLALVAIFAVFALGFVVSPGRAQPGRPPGFQPPRPPGFPAPPTPPRPNFGGPGIGGGGIPSPPGFGGPSRSEWVCSNCRFVVGTGPVRPNVTQCPRCSVRFSNPGPGGAGAAPGAPAGPDGEPPAPTLVAPELPTNPAAGLPGEPAPADPGEPSASPAAPAQSGTDVSAPSREPEAKGGPRTLLIVGIVIAGVFIFGTLAMLAVVVSKANSPHQSRRPRRPRPLELD